MYITQDFGKYLLYYFSVYCQGHQLIISILTDGLSNMQYYYRAMDQSKTLLLRRKIIYENNLLLLMT